MVQQNNDIVALWGYACNLYQKEGVKDVCLSLQDIYQVNVPLLLFLSWLATRACDLTGPQKEEVENIVSLWSKNCIEPLRLIRQRMKAVTIGVGQKDWVALREQVKQLELAAEKSLLEQLENWANSQNWQVIDQSDFVFAQLVEMFYPSLINNPKVQELIKTITKL